MNDEDRSSCLIYLKDFTMFRRKHHCRVCFEIICNNYSLTRKKMRVCVVCAGLRPPTDPTASRPQNRRRRRFLESGGEFLTEFGTRFRTRGTATRSVWEYNSGVTALYSNYSMPQSWEDDIITAVRTPRNSVKILKIISRGAFGEVHLGTWNDMQVAVKTLLPELRTNISRINEFQEEAKMIALMDHPCIVSLIGVAWESLTDVCVVTEYMDGGDLRSLLSQYEMDQCPLGFDASKLSIALNVADALTYLHSLSPRIIHRDLKSRNILLNRALEAKVTDFGVSRPFEDRAMTAGVGTFFWMAPEVLMGESYKEKADIFSFGIVSELATHQVLYSNESDNKRPAILLQRVANGDLRAHFSEAGPQSVVDLEIRASL